MFACAVSRLLADPAYCERLGAKGREMVVGNHSVEAMLSRIEGFYEALAAGRGIGRTAGDRTEGAKE
jgi:glycosyltransferase involved in cell wall biosynthesis